MLTLKQLAAAAAVSTLPLAASAASFTLNFGNVSAPDFETTGVISYTGVAAGINATLTAAAGSFTSNVPANNGSVADDLRINLAGGETANLTLTLWDATAGDGFSTVYDPGQNYSWMLGFYDIDGRNSSFYDEVTLSTPGTYTVTTSTLLNVDAGVGSVVFSGDDVNGDVAGQAGLSGTLTQEQSDVAVLLELTNRSVVNFSYSVFGDAFRNRNMLVDGGEISLAGSTTTGSIAPVPLPAAGLLMFAGLGGLAALRARKG